MFTLSPDLPKSLIIGTIIAKNIRVQDSPPELLAQFEVVKNELLANSDQVEKRKLIIRDLLRTKHFKPTGRSKPASEYLINTLLCDGIRSINNLVDINNLLSIKWQLPISTFDLDKCVDNFTIRHGYEGEKYVFNQSGQELDLHGLLLVADEEDAVGNPVKDSMRTKTTVDTKNVLIVVYSDQQITSSQQMQQYLNEYISYIESFEKTSEITSKIFTITV